MSALRTYRICFLLSAFVLTNLTVSAQSDTLEEQTVSHAVQKRVEKDRVILRGLLPITAFSDMALKMAIDWSDGHFA